MNSLCTFLIGAVLALLLLSSFTRSDRTLGDSTSNINPEILECDSALFYTDSDQDSYGDINDNGVWGLTCDPPPGKVRNSDDCDDSDPLVHPAAVEECDGKDTDCDGFIPPEEVDQDGDGFLACMDCNDTNPNTYYGAIEICDGQDNNCDGIIPIFEQDGDGDGLIYCLDCDDADPLNTTVSDSIWYFLDADGDGFGNPADSLYDWTCSPEPDRVANSGDCDDTDPSVYPGASELCDGKDSNCDGIGDPDFDQDGIPDCSDNCPFKWNAGQVDNDCDEVGDSCDWCPGGDDRIDNNGDGQPDCIVYPGLSFIPQSWLCPSKNPNAPQKVIICRDKTRCISASALQVNDTMTGFFLGPCDAIGCDEGVPDVPSQNELFSAGTSMLDDELRVNVINPFDDQLTILITGSRISHGQIQLYNVFGTPATDVVSLKDQATVSLDSSNLPPGQYVLVVRTLKNHLVVPLLKIH